MPIAWPEQSGDRMINHVPYDIMFFGHGNAGKYKAKTSLLTGYTFLSSRKHVWLPSDATARRCAGGVCVAFPVSVTVPFGRVRRLDVYVSCAR